MISSDSVQIEYLDAPMQSFLYHYKVKSWLQPAVTGVNKIEHTSGIIFGVARGYDVNELLVNLIALMSCFEHKQELAEYFALPAAGPLVTEAMDQARTQGFPVLYNDIAKARLLAASHLLLHLADEQRQASYQRINNWRSAYQDPSPSLDELRLQAAQTLATGNLIYSVLKPEGYQEKLVLLAKYHDDLSAHLNEAEGFMRDAIKTLTTARDHNHDSEQLIADADPVNTTWQKALDIWQQVSNNCTKVLVLQAKYSESNREAKVQARIAMSLLQEFKGELPLTDYIKIEMKSES